MPSGLWRAANGWWQASQFALRDVGYASSAQHKREHTPKRKRSRSRSGGLDNDLNYVDEDSELSSGDDALIASDIEAHPYESSGAQHTRKRGRPKAHYMNERSKPQASTSASAALSSHNYIPPALPSGYESDHDPSGELKVDKYGRLLGGKLKHRSCCPVNANAKSNTQVANTVFQHSHCQPETIHYSCFQRIPQHY